MLDHPSTDYVAEKETRIRERAYFLWQQAGAPPGEAETFWRKASEEEEAQAGQDLTVEKKLDKDLKDSFPASDAPSNTGIAGPGHIDEKPKS